MRYGSGRAFRQALERRIRVLSQQTVSPLVRLRKMVAFDRLLARLLADSPRAWILKGGLALQFRLQDKARTTKDIDLLSMHSMEEAQALLKRAASRKLDDWSQFEMGQTRGEAEALPPGGRRFPVHALLDGRTFESFHLDLSTGDPVCGEPDWLTGPPAAALRWDCSRLFSLLPSHPAGSGEAPYPHAAMPEEQAGFGYF